MNARTQHTMGSWTREAGMKEPTGSDVSNPLAVKAVRNARGGQPGRSREGEFGAGRRAGGLDGGGKGGRERRSQYIARAGRQSRQRGAQGRGGRVEGGKVGAPAVHGKPFFLALSCLASAPTHTRTRSMRASGPRAGRVQAGQVQETRSTWYQQRAVMSSATQ